MPLEDTTATLAIEKGLGIINGVKGIGLATDTALQVPVTITGGLLIGGGVVLLAVPAVFLGANYVSKWKRTKGGKQAEHKVFSANTNMLMSLAVASSLCVSVGTAMLPRTVGVMVVHVIAGYTCLVLSIIHVYQYRRVIKAQAKKYWKFLSAPKGAHVMAKAAVA